MRCYDKSSALIDLSVLYIPAQCKKIEEEAFSGLAYQAVIIPESCTAVCDHAFSDCANLLYDKIPSSVTNCSLTAFEGCNDNLGVDWTIE